jgi:hypothetical protein
MAMIMIEFGKYAGKPVQLVLLQDPDYALWLLAQKAATRSFREVQQEVRRLIARFDALPLLTTCASPECDNPATRATVARGTIQVRWWCDDCDPDDWCPDPNRLVLIASFADAVFYADGVGRRCLAALVRTLAEAKGLPAARLTERRALAFFI